MNNYTVELKNIYKNSIPEKNSGIEKILFFYIVSLYLLPKRIIIRTYTVR